MSNFLAIATTTAAFRSLVLEAIQADVPGSTVSMARPAEPGGAAGIPTLATNIFLYEVTPIASLRNEALPTRRNGSGSLIQRPAVTIELHYLLSFYGNDANLEPQRMMGSVIAKIAAEPMLTGNRLNAAITDPSVNFLATSDLPQQPDRIKFSPMTLSTEDMSRIWSVFIQSRYALSMVWKATAIVIEPQIQSSPALPVREPLLGARPIRKPLIERVIASSGARDPILSAGDIIIRGERLLGTDMEILVDGHAVQPNSTSDFEIELSLPANVSAGPQRVQVHHRLQLGDPPTPHAGVLSESFEFVLHPVIAQQGGAYQIVLSNQNGAGSNPRDADVAITLTSSVGQRQQTTLELLTRPTDSTPATVRYSFFANQRTAAGTVLNFEVRGVEAGDYLARVRINGADSPLDRDPNPASPTFDRPIAPLITF